MRISLCKHYIEDKCVHDFLLLPYLVDIFVYDYLYIAYHTAHIFHDFVMLVTIVLCS